MEKNKENVLRILKSGDIGVIATADDKGNPEAATINYFVDDDLNLYFVTRRHTRKFQNLEKNKNIAFVVGTTTGTQTIQMNGEARKLEEKDEIQNFIMMINQNPEIKNLYTLDCSLSPFFKIEGTDFELFKVKINWLRWMHLEENSNKEIYTQII